MLYMITRLPAYIFYPLICIWSVLFGVIGGIAFKLAAVVENWWSINRLQLLLWKKYPQRSYQKYINGIWASQIRGRPVELAEYTRSRIEQARPKQPFPIVRLVLNTLMMLFLAPFIALSGIVDGPVYVFKRGLAMRQAEARYQSNIT